MSKEVTEGDRKIRFDGLQKELLKKVLYGQEPPSGESTTTEYGVNYQLLAVIYWSNQMGNS